MTDSSPLTVERFEEAMVLRDAHFDHVMDLSNERFEKAMSAIDARFNKIDGRLDKIDNRLDGHDGLIHSLVDGQQILIQETRDIKYRVINLEHSMEEVQESLRNLEMAEAKDAEATISHEARIQRLEKINKVRSVPPGHLREISA